MPIPVERALGLLQDRDLCFSLRRSSWQEPSPRIRFWAPGRAENSPNTSCRGWCPPQPNQAPVIPTCCTSLLPKIPHVCGCGAHWAGCCSLQQVPAFWAAFLHVGYKRRLTFPSWGISEMTNGLAIKMKTCAETSLIRLGVARLRIWKPSISPIKQNKMQ